MPSRIQSCEPRLFGRNRRAREQRRGWILLEVIVAFTIFLIALVGLMIGMNRLMDATALTRREGMLLTKLQSRLEEARFQPLEPGTFKDERPDDDGVEYIRVVEELELENIEEVPLSGLYEVTVRAMWPRQDGGVDEISAQVIMRDTQSGAAVLPR